MEDIHALCVLVSALAGCGGLPRLPLCLSLGVITACPCGSVLSGNASVLQCAGKNGILNTVLTCLPEEHQDYL